MSLPIIRLRAVSANNATATDDPVTASCTLYTFLRSVPTRFECEMAMNDFKQRLQAASGPGCLSAGNAKVLALVHAAVHDRLLRQLPAVIPRLARDAPTWRVLLSGEGEKRPAGSATDRFLEAQGNAHPAHGDEDAQPLVPSSSLLFSSSVCTGGHKEPDGTADSNAEIVVVKETVSSEAMRFKSPYEQILPERCLFAHDSPTTSIDCETQAGDADDDNGSVDDVDQPMLLEHSPPPCTHPDDLCRTSQLHPLLRAMLDKIRSNLPAEENERDRQEREFVALMESKVVALRTKLSSSFSMISPQDRGSLEFLEQLEQRVDVAEKLFEVQRHEQETIQMTQFALMMEIAAMRALFHRIVDVVAETEERHAREGSSSPHYAGECHIMAAIQQALDELPS